MLKKLYVLMLAVCFFSTAYAADSEEPEAIDIAKFASQFVVRVAVESSDLFAPSNNGGHGSGFIVSLSKTKGIIFTNRHVVEKDPTDVQKVTLEFVTDTRAGKPESLQGEVVYISPVTDLAVIEFDPRKLKRASIQVAQLAAPDLLEKLTTQGRGVMAYGHPLDGRNISTFGAITGEERQGEEKYIQTDAPINPGNSGGPLIDQETALVVGMNTAIIEHSNNIGYAIPMDTLLADFLFWKEHPKSAVKRRILANFELFDEKNLRRQGVLQTIEKLLPGFNEKYSGALLVTDAAESSLLETGDILLRAEGEVIGDHEYLFRRLYQWQPRSSVRLEVLRNGKLKKIVSPLVNIHQALKKQETDFVMISGVVFYEVDPFIAWRIGRGENRVAVQQVLRNTVGAEFSDIRENSIITQVRLGDRTYEIKTLADLKKVAKILKTGHQPLLITLKKPIRAEIDDHRIEIGDAPAQYPLVMPITDIKVLPVDSVILPSDLDLKKMRKGFDFEGNNPKTRDWRNWCKKALQ